MIAPIVITVLFVLYLTLYFALIFYEVEGIAKILLGIIPAVLAAVMIYFCLQRIKEIEGGEEDDLSKY